MRFSMKLVIHLEWERKGMKHAEAFKTDDIGTIKHKGHQLHDESTSAHHQLLVGKCGKREIAGNQARRSEKQNSS